MTVEDLYQEELLELAKDASHRGEIVGFTHRYKGKNPLCGDVIEVFLKIEGDKITDLSFVGEGCAISQASAALMASKLKGIKVSEIKAEIERVSKLLATKEHREIDEADDITRVLGGVKKFPTRLRCALLGWKSVEIALKDL